MYRRVKNEIKIFEKSQRITLRYIFEDKNTQGERNKNYSFLKTQQNLSYFAYLNLKLALKSFKCLSSLRSISRSFIFALMLVISLSIFATVLSVLFFFSSISNKAI